MGYAPEGFAPYTGGRSLYRLALVVAPSVVRLKDEAIFPVEGSSNCMTVSFMTYKSLHFPLLSFAGLGLMTYIVADYRERVLHTFPVKLFNLFGSGIFRRGC